MTKCVVLSPDTNSPVDCLCLAKGLALGQARPAGPSRQAVLSLDIQNRDRYDVILANPPFGGKERKEVQQNFPIKTGETAFLFLQHFIKTLKAGGRAGIVIKNTFLSNADNASTSIRKLLLESCNLHTVLDCPGGTFQGAGVKTVVLSSTAVAERRPAIDHWHRHHRANPSDAVIVEPITMISMDLRRPTPHFASAAGARRGAASPAAVSVPAAAAAEHTAPLSRRGVTGGQSIKTVARHAGVSVATVSRVLNESGPVHAKTRTAVEASIQTLGYQTNHLARNLRTARTGMVLVTIPDMRNPFYARVLEGISSQLQASGYLMAVADTHPLLALPENRLHLIAQRKVDGAICLDPHTVHQAIAHDLTDHPWVACAEYDRDLAVPFVGIDNELAAADAVRYLLRRGHRRIALVNYDARYLFARQREAGWRLALAEAGLVPDPALMHTAEGLGYDEGAAVATRLLELPEPPDAVFCVSDTLALGVLRTAAMRGLRIPQQLAVVGFDDIDFAAQSLVPLTTIAQPMEILGRTAADLLLQRLREPNRTPKGVLLRHELKLRASA